MKPDKPGKKEISKPKVSPPSGFRTKSKAGFSRKQTSTFSIYATVRWVNSSPEAQATHVRKWDLKLDLELHETRELHIFNDNRNTLANYAFPNTSFQNNFPKNMVSKQSRFR